MAYCISKNTNGTVSVPKIILDKLKHTEDDWIKVALYIVQNNDCDTKNIAQALNLKSEQCAKDALLFWKGAGLLEDEDETSSTNNSTFKQAVKNKGDITELNVNGETKQTQPKIKKHTHLTTQEVTTAADGDYAIALLVQESQRLMGAVISQPDLNIYVSMYMLNDMPIDFILLGIAHFASIGKRSARYIERALISWQQQGITTCKQAEDYLHTQEKQEKYTQLALSILNMQQTKPSKAERALIWDWFEVYKFDEKMIAEAAGVAADKKSIKYVGGILRKWNEKGYKTIKDVIHQSNITMQNTQVSNPNAKNVLSGSIKPVPTFKPKKGG